MRCPPHIPIFFGFDTACKTYATLVGNVAVDALSAQKYYHVVRLMGRSASNITLEVALLTRPNACLIGEEVARDGRSLKDLRRPRLCLALVQFCLFGLGSCLQTCMGTRGSMPPWGGEGREEPQRRARRPRLCRVLGQFCLRYISL